MREQKKTVYYCIFCKKHGLMRGAMEKHERHCTMNPERVCRWGDNPHSVEYVDIAQVMAESDPLRAQEITWLRKRVDNCPACMLSVLRQSGLHEYHYDLKTGERIFDYKEEIERFRELEQRRVFEGSLL